MICLSKGFGNGTLGVFEVSIQQIPIHDQQTMHITRIVNSTFQQAPNSAQAPRLMPVQGSRRHVFPHKNLMFSASEHVFWSVHPSVRDGR